MKCPKCGSEIGTAKFCPECGEKMSVETYEDMQIPIGKYKGNAGTITIDSVGVCIEKRPLFKAEQTRVPFSNLAAVFYTKASSSFKSGFLCVRDRKNLKVPPATGFNAPSDPYSINFISADNEKFYSLYLFLEKVADKNQIIPIASKDTEIPDHAGTCDPGESTENESHIVDADHAVKVCPNCGDILLAHAVRCPTCGEKAKGLSLIDKDDSSTIDAAVAQAPHPKNSLTPKWMESAAPYSATSQAKPLSKKERIKENRANGVACCPKCGSTSLSANKKGFGVGKAALGVATIGLLGAVAGGIGSGKVIVTCLNCGHRWKI